MLGIEIGANLNAHGFEQGSRNVEQALNKMRHHAESETGGMVGGLSEKLLKLGGIGFTINEVFERLKGGVEVGAQLFDLRERTDTNIEALQRYSNAARRSGVELSALAKHYDNLRKAVGMAEAGGQGGAEMRRHLVELGTTLEEVQSIGVDKFFDNLLVKMGEGSLTAKEFAAAFKIMGKGFGEMIPLARDLAEESHGDLFFNDHQIEQLKRAENVFSDLWNNIKVGTGESIAFLQDFAEWYALSKLTGDKNAWSKQMAEEAKARKELEERRKADREKRDEAEREDEMRAAKEAADIKAEKHADEISRIHERRDAALLRGLPESERLEKMKERQYDLAKRLTEAERSTGPINPAEEKRRAEMEARLEEINADIQSLEGKKKRGGFHHPVTALQHIGAYIPGINSVNAIRPTDRSVDLLRTLTKHAAQTVHEQKVTNQKLGRMEVAQSPYD